MEMRCIDHLLYIRSLLCMTQLCVTYKYSKIFFLFDVGMLNYFCRLLNCKTITMENCPASEFLDSHRLQRKIYSAVS